MARRKTSRQMVRTGPAKRQFKPPAFTGRHYPEPRLVFGSDFACPDPKLGLELHGPVTTQPGRSPSLTTIDIGIIGTAETITLAKDWLAQISAPIDPPEGKAVRFPGFPGFEATFRCRLAPSRVLDFPLDSDAVQAVLVKLSHNQKVRAAVDLFVQGLRALSNRIPRPQVVICAIPAELDDLCRSTTGGGSGPKLSPDEKWLKKKLEGHSRTGQQRLVAFEPETLELLEAGVGFQFRRMLKAAAMEFRMPTQLARPRTFTGGKGTQDAATRAWNFSVALYSKAGGYPWRPHNGDPQTCYVGLSFFKAGKHMRAALAQVFTLDGVGLVLRGQPFEWDDPHERAPHLSNENAQQVLEDALRLYQESNAGQMPKRLVIHKPSRYWPEELAGLTAAARHVPQRDFLTLARSGTRFFRLGTNAPLRGTTISLGAQHHLIYTKGYVPHVRYYPGPRVPRPLEILEHHGSAPLETLVSEILALSKLNWNSADFSASVPMTMAFANRVGDIMKALPEEVVPLPEYRYYM